MLPLTFVTKPSRAAQEVEDRARSVLGHLTPARPIVVAIGGDGTLLQAAKEYLHQDVVFVGVSAGSLGLLQTVEPDELDKLAQAIQHQTYELMHSPLLEVAYCRPLDANAKNDEMGDVIGYGFNDISVERQESRAAKFKLKIDESDGTFIGDGLIFSTPLGSTAYSLAAGGPIIDSAVQDVFIVTPNNPHISRLNSSLQRPHVLNKSRHIRIELADIDKADRPLQIAIDGQIAARNITEPIKIMLSKKYVQLLQLEKDSVHKNIEAKRLGRL